MPIYTEKKDKFKLRVSSNTSIVKIMVDCEYGTIASVSFDNGNSVEVRCGETEDIGPDIKGKQIEFNGNANNPDKRKIKVIHTIYEENGSSITYKFPDDYTGSPVYNKDEKEPDYKFFVNLV